MRRTRIEIGGKNLKWLTATPVVPCRIAHVAIQPCAGADIRMSGKLSTGVCLMGTATDGYEPHLPNQWLGKESTLADALPRINTGVTAQPRPTLGQG